MMVLSLSCTARSKSASNSAFCSAVLKPFLDGQSRFAIVAIQAPRNSRKGLGGTIPDDSSAAARKTACDAAQRKLPNNATAKICPLVRPPLPNPLLQRRRGNSSHRTVTKLGCHRLYRNVFVTILVQCQLL